jgi:hypothetical protein
METTKSCNDAVVCVLGDLCILKTGDIGVCQPLTQCTTAVYKALHGDIPNVCSIKEDMPIVCCGRSPTVRLQPEANQNIMQKQNQPQFTSQYYLFDAETHEMPSADFPVRYSRGDRNEPWWLIEKPFAVTPPAALQKPPSRNENHGNNSHHQGTSRPGNLHNHWWYSERPFNSAPPPPPPPPPPPSSPPTPLSPPPKPITQPLQSTSTRHGQERVSEISKLNPNIQNSCASFFCGGGWVGLTTVWMRYPFFWDITLHHWVFDSKCFKTMQWSHLQRSECPEKIHFSWTFRPLKKITLSCLRILGKNYSVMQHHVPEWITCTKQGWCKYSALA